jgi:3-hydroxy-9,10-secoandrosta-1,3,5(10)-triene-9,17-dione monooxygenase
MTHAALEMARAKPSREDLVARAQALAPMLQARRAEADARRDLAPDTVAKFAEAGLFALFKPEAWGGWAADPDIFFDVQNAIAEHCLSSAWIFGVFNVQSFVLALFDRRAQASVWGKPGTSLISSSFRPAGTAIREAGGFRLTGRWSFSSGSNHCQFALLGAMIPPADADSKPEMRLFLVPREDYEIVDAWDTFGLRGTGSHDIRAADVFVPDYHSWQPDAGLTVSSREARPGAALYRLPWLYMFSSAISNLAIGGGRGAVSAFRGAGRGRLPSMVPGSNMADRWSAPAARAHTEIEAADMVLKTHVRTMMRYAEAGEAMPLAEGLLYRAQLTATTRRIAEQVDQLMLLLGGRGVRSDAPLTRIWLDLCAARHHPGNDPDAARSLLGGELIARTPIDG